jgi:DeoR/GlpR family transcriptional regulator of sugar metabolism
LGDHVVVTIADLAELLYVSRATVYRILDRQQAGSASSISGGQ